MGRRRQITVEAGQVYGRLMVLEEVPGPRRQVRVRCSCAEATEKLVQLTSLMSGATQSCGCHNREAAASRARSRKLPPEQRKPKYVPVVPRFRMDDFGRECSKCSVYQPWHDFAKGNGARGFTSWCRACQREHHSLTPAEDRRAGSLRRRLARFGLTISQYDSLVARYDNCCWRCRRPETAVSASGNVQRLSVDHDHACCPGDRSCGKCIRGLLCVSCNFVLGRIDGGQVDSYITYLARGYVDLA